MLFTKLLIAHTVHHLWYCSFKGKKNKVFAASGTIWLRLDDDHPPSNSIVNSNIVIVWDILFSNVGNYMVFHDLQIGRTKVELRVMHFKLVILAKDNHPLQLSFTTEQLDRQYKILESDTLSCSIAPKCNSSLLSVSPSRAWIVDSGASEHMTSDSTPFSSYSPCAGNHEIKVVYGSFLAIGDNTIEPLPAMA
ncbi:TMV resistance protein N [Trifolium pratense]|uniref:TMV resistance protein N n=1 Tax=Trifolium pratense TaxID=57577 RepID=A0A2K3PM49_TRIPR|nr:TMV resistance protein N [Trifolium pratense]